MVQNENELMHFGVLGMKWGVRRYQPYSVKPRGSGKGGKEVGAAKKHRDPDYEIKRDRRDASKNRRHLSDEELTRRIGRLKKEQELKNLTKDDVSPGQKDAEEILKSIGKNSVKVIGTAAVLWAGKNILNKVMPGIDQLIKLPKK